MLKRFDEDLQSLYQFLQVKTPEAWLNQALKQIPLLLIDHAHCERKAAASAINFISKYPERAELVQVMSPLAREELLHFEKVLDLIKKRKLSYGPLQPSQYASNLHKQVTRKNNLDRLCEQLIVGAIIEARSCERFHALSMLIEDEECAKFYSSLVKAEARHFENYLDLAKKYGGEIGEKVEQFIAIENQFILSRDPDQLFRFHSGI